MCYKRRKNKITGWMMAHTKCNLGNKTVLPISLRPKYIDKRAEPGHLEMDSILGNMPRKIFDYKCVYDVELDYHK